MSKIFTILGGNGYVGKRVIKKLLQNTKDTKIYAVCRSGKLEDPEINKHKDRVEIIKGDALNPESFQDILKQSDGIVHSIGKLITNTEEYHKFNKRSLLNCLDLLDKDKKYNVVYISAQRGMPFPASLMLHGYIEAKREAEKQLIENYDNVNPIVLRPGIIKDNKDRLWSLPLYYESNMSKFFERNVLDKMVPGIGDKINLPARGTELEDLAKFTVAGLLGNLNEKIYSDEDLANSTKIRTLNLI